MQHIWLALTHGSISLFFYLFSNVIAQVRTLTVWSWWWLEKAKPEATHTATLDSGAVVCSQVAWPRLECCRCAETVAQLYPAATWSSLFDFCGDLIENKFQFWFETKNKLKFSRSLVGKICSHMWPCRWLSAAVCQISCSSVQQSVSAWQQCPTPIFWLCEQKKWQFCELILFNHGSIDKKSPISINYTCQALVNSKLNSCVTFSRPYSTGLAVFNVLICFWKTELYRNLISIWHLFQFLRRSFSFFQSILCQSLLTVLTRKAGLLENQWHHFACLSVFVVRGRAWAIEASVRFVVSS